MLQDSDCPNGVKGIVCERQSFGIRDLKRLVVVLTNSITEICSRVIIHNILKCPTSTAYFKTTRIG